jgi:hypothetical protein
MKSIAWAVLWLLLFPALPANVWSQEAPRAFSFPSFTENTGLGAKPPTISVNPNSVNFGNLNSGSTSEKMVTIKNTGGTDLVISSITLSGSNASDFGQANDCATLSGGKSCLATVTFAPSSGGKKTAVMTITSNDPKKQIVNVKLSGTAKAPACVYSLSSSGQECGASGGTWSVNVNAPGGCAWTAACKESWITIASGGSGSGNGTVAYAVASNASTSERKGKMTIAKQTFTVTQSGASCTYSISPASRSCGPSGETGSVSVTSATGCNWTAASNEDWITIKSGGSGSGNGTVAYAVASNASTSERTGTMTVAGQTFTATQSGADSPPVAALSEYQQGLLDSYGNPDYLSIVFSSEPPRKQETWVYAGLQKMYLFWDGESLGQTDITPDPDAYSDAPYLDPSFFTKDSKLPDLVELLGSDYTEVDRSLLKDVVGDADFKTYQFGDMGLFVAFLNGKLAAVQTIDIPEGAAGLSTTKSPSGDERKSDIDAGRVLASETKLTIYGVMNLMVVTNAIYMLAGVNVKQDPYIQQFIIKKCDSVFTYDTSDRIKECTGYLVEAIKNALSILESADLGLSSAGQQTVAVSSATDKCGTTGKQFAATDDAFPFCPGTCAYSISSTSDSFDSRGGRGSIEVTTKYGCTFMAVSNNPDWIHVTSGSSSASGRAQPLLSIVGTVTYEVDPNTSGAGRKGTITVAGRTFTVNQSATSSCTYSISSTSESFDPGGGTGSIEVTTQADCTVTAVSNVAWITISPPAGGAKMKVQPLLSYVHTVQYTVAPNTSGSDRTGTLTVAGKTVTVTQSPCTYSISSTNQSFDSTGGTGSIEVTTAYMGCAATVTAVSNAAWITISPPGSSGNIKGQPLLSFVYTVHYTVAPNTSGASRTGTITVAGQTVTVNQSATSTKNYSGSFNGSFSISWDTCACITTFSGDVSMVITFQPDGTYAGSVGFTGALGTTCTPLVPNFICHGDSGPASDSTSVSGRTPGISWIWSSSGGSTYSFTGSINGNTISGTITFRWPNGDVKGSTSLTLTAQ